MNIISFWFFFFFNGDKNKSGSVCHGPKSGSLKIVGIQTFSWLLLKKFDVYALVISEFSKSWGEK